LQRFDKTEKINNVGADGGNKKSKYPSYHILDS
jgi:hypothetical protein